MNNNSSSNDNPDPDLDRKQPRIMSQGNGWTFGFFILLIAALFLAGCNLSFNSKNVRVITSSNMLTTAARPVSGFTSINNMITFGWVIITQGNHESLTIDKIDITAMNSDNGLTFTITVKDLTTLTNSGAGKFTMDNVTGNNLPVNLSGAGQFILGKLTVEPINITLSGVGGIEVAGEATSAKIDISGAGSIKAADLKIKTAEITIFRDRRR